MALWAEGLELLRAPFGLLILCYGPNGRPCVFHKRDPSAPLKEPPKTSVLRAGGTLKCRFVYIMISQIPYHSARALRSTCDPP